MHGSIRDQHSIVRLATLAIGGVLLAACSSGATTAAGDAGHGEAGHGPEAAGEFPAPPDEAGAQIELTGEPHEGTMRLDRVEAAHYDPGTGEFELLFRSDDDGKLYLKGTASGDTASGEDLLASFEIPLHVSHDAVQVRDYLAGDGECEVRFEATDEGEATGAIRCVGVPGERGSRLRIVLGGFSTAG